MNKVILMGRLTRDPDIRYTDGGLSVARFSVAVDRRFSKDHEADFISCVAFGKTAEFIEKYFGKGQRIGLTGRIQTGSYTNRDGTKVYTTDVVAEAVEFVESKASSAGAGANTRTEPAETQGTDIGDGFLAMPDNLDDEDLPFN